MVCEWKQILLVTVGRDYDGMLIRKQFYGKTKQEVLDKADEYKNKYKSGQISADEKITDQQWVKTGLFQYNVNDLKNSSLVRYEGL